MVLLIIFIRECLNKRIRHGGSQLCHIQLFSVPSYFSQVHIRLLYIQSNMLDMIPLYANKGFNILTLLAH